MNCKLSISLFIFINFLLHDYPFAAAKLLHKFRIFDIFLDWISHHYAFVPWGGKIPWRRKWQSIPVFLPGEFHGQRSLVGHSPWVTKSQTQLSTPALCSCSLHSIRFLLQFLDILYLSVQFSSVAQSCPTLCDPMSRSTPGLPVHHQLPEFTQTHVHRVSDAIQPSHPLSAPSPPAPNPSQHHSLFQWVNSSHEVAKVLEFQL